MRLYNPQEPFIAPRSSKITKIIEFIRSTNGYPVTLISNDSTLFGIISNGDIIRYLSKSKNIAIEEINAEEVANQFPKSVNISDSYETIDGFLSNKSIRSLPILNDKREVKKIVTCQNPSIAIGSKNINEFEEPFLIGEIGVNHNGDLKEAKYLIREASKAGCDAIKFQYRSKQLYFKNDINKYDLGTQYILSEIDKTRMSIMEIEECCKLAKILIWKSY